MTDFNAEVRVDLTGNITTAAQAQAKAIERMSRRSARSLSRLRTIAGRSSAAIDRIGNRYTALAAGGGLALAARGVVSFEARLKSIERQARITTEEAEALKQSVFDTALDSRINLDPSQLLEAVEAVIEKTGDLKLAMDNLPNMAIAMRAADAGGFEIGAVLSGFKKLGITARDDVAQAFALLIEQGKTGSFTMKNFAAEAGPLMAALAAAGYSGVDAIRQLGAVAQITQNATDSAAESSTAIQAFLRQLAVRADELERKGLKIWDEEALARGEQKLRALPELIREIVTKSEAKEGRLSPIFGEEGIKALKDAMANFKETGDFSRLDEYMQVFADVALVEEDAAAKAGIAAAAFSALSGQFAVLADENLAGPIQTASEAFHALGEEGRRALFDIGKAVAFLAGGIWLGNKVLRWGGALRSALPGKGSSGGPGGALGAASAATAVQPVFVTNWPAAAGLGPGSGGASARSTRGRGTPGTVRAFAAGRGTLPAATGLRQPSGRTGALLSTGARAFKGASASLYSTAGRFVRGAGPVALGLGAFHLGSAALSGDGRAVSGAGGALAGGLLGAKGGALAGAFAGPIGIAVGSVLGGTLGALLGEEALSGLFDRLSGPDDGDDPSRQDRQEQLEASRELTRALEDNTRARLQASRRQQEGGISPHFSGGLHGGAP